MGTKFNNTLLKTDTFHQNRQALKDELSNLVPDETFYFKEYKEFTVLLGSSYDIDMLEAANKISRIVDFTVAFHYFDDDFLEIQVSQNGQDTLYLTFGDEDYCDREQIGALGNLKDYLGFRLSAEVLESDDLEDIISEIEEHLKLTIWMSGEWLDEEEHDYKEL